jgi:hypothetical protein
MNVGVVPNGGGLVATMAITCCPSPKKQRIAG